MLVYRRVWHEKPTESEFFQQEKLALNDQKLGYSTYENGWNPPRTSGFSPRKIVVHQPNIRIWPTKMGISATKNCIKHSSMGISGSDWLEVPTIYKAYFSGLNFRESTHNSYYGLIWYSTSINWILEWPLKSESWYFTSESLYLTNTNGFTGDVIGIAEKVSFKHM
jgi:hypothetical protein